MAMIKFEDYYINPKHISCVGMKEESLCGRVSGEKTWYEVFVICYDQKISTTRKTRSEAEELVKQIVMYSN